MNELFDYIGDLYGRLPFPVIACLAGWAVSIGLTQPVKFLLPLNWYPKSRQVITQGIAFASAFLVVHGMVPGGQGVILGLITGLWSPMAYSLAIRLLENRYPALADILSGDVRGTMKGDVRENRPDVIVHPPSDALP